MTPQHPEIGRELLTDDLRTLGRKVIVLQKEGQSLFATAWLLKVGDVLVTFGLGEARVILALEIQPDGTLQDDMHRQIHVFEYLGEI